MVVITVFLCASVVIGTYRLVTTPVELFGANFEGLPQSRNSRGSSPAERLGVRSRPMPSRRYDGLVLKPTIRERRCPSSSE